jgi:hypothetical protein
MNITTVKPGEVVSNWDSNGGFLKYEWDDILGFLKM